MQIKTNLIEFNTQGEIDIIDLSSRFEDLVRKSNIKEGILAANVIGSTGALTAIEYESRVLDDFKQILEKLVPKGAGYKHDLIDSNAHSHLRAGVDKPPRQDRCNIGRSGFGCHLHIQLAAALEEPDQQNSERLARR